MKYYVKYLIDPVGTFDTFEAALEAYKPLKHEFIYSSECDYSTDQGFDDGLTEEQREQL